MDPFNIANLGQILSRNDSYRGGHRRRARITRALHALVVFSMLLPGGVVTAAPMAVQDVPSAEVQVEEKASAKPYQNPEYSPPTFQRPEPRRVQRDEILQEPDSVITDLTDSLLEDSASRSNVSTNGLLEPTPTPTPDPDNPPLPPVFPPLGESVDQPEMLLQAFGAEPLSEGQEAGSLDQLISGDPSNESFPITAYNSTEDEYLIVWMDDADPNNLHATIMDHQGQEVLPEFLIGTQGVGAPKRPELAYNFTDNTYMLLWSEPTGNYVSYYGLIQELHNLYALPLASDGASINPSPTLIIDQQTFFDIRMAYDLVYNPTANQFLVAWQMPPGLVLNSIYQPHTLYVQEIDAAASLQGSSVAVHTGMVSSVRVEYSSVSDEYIVTWDLAYYGSLGYEIYARRLEPGSLAFLGSTIGVNGLVFGWQGDVRLAYADSTDRYLVTFEDTRPVVPGEYIPDIYGQVIQAGTGARVGDNFAILESEDPVGPGDVAYLPGTDQFVVIGLPETNHITVRLLDSNGEIASDEYLFTTLFGIQPRIAPRTVQNTELYRMLVTWTTDGDIYGRIPVKDLVSEAACLVSIDECNAEGQTQNEEGEPINTRTGAYDYSVEDLLIQTSAGPLAFRRVYASFGTDLYTEPLGFGWTHNLASRLIFPDDPEGGPGVIFF